LVPLFGKKNDGESTGNGEEPQAFEPQPEKARQWFNHAQAAAETYNYAYALSCYANGIKLDPEVMSTHEAMYAAGVQYSQQGGRPATGREIRGIEGSHPIAKFAAAEFAWMKDITNATLALKMMAAAIKAQQFEFGNWIATSVLNLLRRQTKPSKTALLQAKDFFAEVAAWDEALVAGEAALDLDRTDSALDAELKDIAAQRAMDRGGYEEAGGKEGGFRRFILDAEKQREIQEAETLATTVSIDQRNLERARREYEQTPTTPDVINRYAQLVKAQGTPEAPQQAYELYMKGHQDTGEYRFRMNAGDIRIEQAAQRANALRATLHDNSQSAEAKTQYEDARREQLDLQFSEFTERVKKYPTDRHIKFGLGEIQYQLGRYEDAMACFQGAKDEPKLRVRAGHMLGRCFAREAWHMEAIGEFKEALGAIDATEGSRELDIRYDLMVSLIEHARTERSVEVAREALEICSGIARKDITYRNIRECRKDVGGLIKELSGGD